jgi:hypothetical protein
VWVADPARDEVVRISEPTALRVGEPFALGDGPVGVVWTGDALWTALAGERRIVVSSGVGAG